MWSDRHAANRIGSQLAEGLRLSEPVSREQPPWRRSIVGSYANKQSSDCFRKLPTSGPVSWNLVTDSGLKIRPCGVSNPYPLAEVQVCLNERFALDCHNGAQFPSPSNREMAASHGQGGYTLTFYILRCICRSHRHEENRRQV
jgi:hypothetical protein